MSKRSLYISFPILLLIAAYFLGPSPAKQQWSSLVPEVPQTPDALEAYVKANEARHVIKPDNEARIIWNDSSRQKTEYAVVYLHGFSASQEEGDPIHTGFAKEFGCNLYLARMADHGIDTADQLLYFSGDRFWESAKEALAIGKAIGNKVIVMSTSTGGTAALMLAAEYPQDVFAIINMSPNIAINNGTAWLLNNPWGLQIARQVLGGKYSIGEMDPEREKYWNRVYRIEAITQLQEMVEDKMNDDTFKKVTCPSLTLYYYKDEQNQDPTVKVSAMLEMNKALSTPADMKVTIAIPDAGAHVIGSYLVSKDLESVRKACFDFAVQKLAMKPVTAL